MSEQTYRQARRAEHRAWLRDFKRACEVCGMTTPHLLTIVDQETGKGLDLGSNAWAIPRQRREDLAARARVLCQAHGHAFRREVANGKE